MKTPNVWFAKNGLTRAEKRRLIAGQHIPAPDDRVAVGGVIPVKVAERRPKTAVVESIKMPTK